VLSYSDIRSLVDISFSGSVQMYKAYGYDCTSVVSSMLCTYSRTNMGWGRYTRTVVRLSSLYSDICTTMRGKHTRTVVRLCSHHSDVRSSVWMYHYGGGVRTPGRSFVCLGVPR
jgi:hypothetical protein